MNVLSGMTVFDDVDWVHLASSIDTWGNRETTWVTPQGDAMPQLIPLNMARVAHIPLEETLREHIANTKTKYEACSSNGESETESESEAKVESKPESEIESDTKSYTNDDMETI